MYATYTDYKDLGYTLVAEPSFDRYSIRAEATVRKYTQDRIVTMNPPDDAPDEVKRVAKLNKRGVCEMIELYYLADHPQSDEAMARQVVTGFSNQEYSESYLGKDRSDAGTAAPEQLTIKDVLQLYFTPNQLWRATS